MTVLLSVLCALALGTRFDQASSQTLLPGLALGNGILILLDHSFLIFLACTVLLGRATLFQKWSSCGKGAKVGAVVLGALFSISIALGDISLEHLEYFVQNSVASLAYIAFKSLLMTPLASLVVASSRSIVVTGMELLDGFVCSRLSRLFTFRTTNVLRLALILFLLWLPWIVLAYPTINMNYDTIVQILWYRGNQYFDWMTGIYYDGYWLGDHHPFFDTLLYGFFDTLGIRLGNEAWGIFMLCLLQAISYALSCAYAVVALKRLGSRCGGQLLLLTYFAFAPFVPLTSMILLKDSTNVCFILPWFVNYLLTARCVYAKAKIHPRNIIGLVLFACFSALSKKTGLYIIVPSTLILLLFAGKQQIKLLPAVLVPALLMLVVVPQVIFPLLRIMPGGKQEMLAIPFQQTARYILECKDEISPEEQEAIGRVLDYDALQNSWYPYNADGPKALYKHDATSDDLRAYLLTWARQGIRHPGVYLRAVPYQLGFYSVGSLVSYGPVFTKWGGAAQYGGKDVLGAYGEQVPTAANRIADFAYRGVVGHAPMLPLLNDFCILVYWLPLLAFYWTDKSRAAERTRLLIELAPLVLGAATLVLSPIFHMRYGYQNIFFSLVVFFACIGRLEYGDAPRERDVAQCATR